VRRFGTLLVFDEIQTGLDAPAAASHCQAADALPIVIVLGKALGGGLTRSAVAVTTAGTAPPRLWRKDRFDLHSSTFCRQRVRMRDRTGSRCASR